MIDQIRPRPGLFIGAPSVERLNAYLNGYRHALTVHGIGNSAEARWTEPPFDWFGDYVAGRLGCGETAMGWPGLLLEHAQGDENRALELFFEECGRYRGLKPTACRSAELTERNERYVEERSTKWYPSKMPVYRGVRRIYDLRMSDGCIHMMLLEWKDGRYEALSSFMFFADEEALESCARKKFGGGLVWKEMSADQLKDLLDETP